MTARKAAYQIIRGGLVLDIQKRSAALADILVDGDSIAAVGRPGMEAPGDARVIDAADRLIMPGLVNAHTHGHGSLGKGLGDFVSHHCVGLVREPYHVQRRLDSFAAGRRGV